MQNSNQKTLKLKRFVIRKSLIGDNVVITFTTKKGTFTYNHDEVYNNRQLSQQYIDRVKDRLSDEQCDYDIPHRIVQCIEETLHYLLKFKSLQKSGIVLLFV